MRRIFASRFQKQTGTPLILMCALVSCLQKPALAQIHDQAYCDSLLVKGVESVLEKKNYPDGLLHLEEARNLAAENQWFRQQVLALNNLGILY